MPGPPRPSAPKASGKSAARVQQQPHRAPAEPPPLVSGRWLLSAFAISLVLAAACGYLALCILFYQGQWQLLFHPSRSVTATPASVGLAFSDIRFDVSETGPPQLEGWWIQAAAPTSTTILYLHDARGSLSDCLPALTTLHALGLNLFAFDYHGFGHSAGAHPTERLATADSVAAWTYLTDTRHIAPRNLIVYGDGTGATFAAHLAAVYAPSAAILEDPNPPARQVFASDARAQILPLFLLQKEHLDPTSDLRRAHVPRLFLDRREKTTRAHQLFLASSDPKQYFDLRSSSDAAVSATLRRFLDSLQH